MSALGALDTWASAVVDTAGSAGLAAIMVLEAVLPVPSEVVLPIVGSQVSSGTVSLLAAVVASTVGSTIGAWVIYTIGRIGGRRRVQRAAGLLGLTDERWAHLESWFDRRGTWVVLLGRCVPGVRVLVNLPAGSMGMPARRFLPLTALGSAAWNTVWILTGSAVVDHWETLLTAVTDARPVVLAAAVAGMVVAVVRQTRVFAVVR